MDLEKVLTAIFQYGGTVIMAGLFVWVFIQDKTKNNKLLEDNTEMIKDLAERNKNIAKSLEIISGNITTIDQKVTTIDKNVDRNYEVELKERRN